MRDHKRQTLLALALGAALLLPLAGCGQGETKGAGETPAESPSGTAPAGTSDGDKPADTPKSGGGGGAS
jgi:hypothetical protein